MQQLDFRSFSGIYPINYGQDSSQQLNVKHLSMVNLNVLHWHQKICEML